MLKKLRKLLLTIPSQPFFLPMLLLVVVAWFMSPMLTSPHFNLVDDGLSIQVGKRLITEPSWSTWKSILYESNVGRFRPAYWIFFIVPYAFGGASAFSFYLAQSAVLASTLVLVYLVSRRLKIPKWWSVAIAGAVLLLPPTVENFYRLGPAEPRQVIWMLLFFWWLLGWLTQPVFKRLWLGVVFFTIALLSKESSIILVPLVITVATLAVAKNPSEWRKWLGFTSVFVVITALFWLAIPPRTSYAAEYQITLRGFLHNIFIVRFNLPELYLLTFAAGLAWLARSSYSWLYLRTHWREVLIASRQHFYLLALISSFTVLQLFWEFQLERYYYVAYIWMLFFIFLEGNIYINFWRSNRSKWSASLVSLGVVLSVGLCSQVALVGDRSLFQFLQRTSENKKTWFEQYQYSGLLTEYLMRYTQPGDQVFIAFNDYEVIYEMGLYASLFGERNVTIFSENQQTVQDFGYPHVLSTDVVSDFIAASGPKLLIFREVPEAVKQAAFTTFLPSTVVSPNTKQSWKVWRP